MKFFLLLSCKIKSSLNPRLQEKIFIIISSKGLQTSEPLQVTYNKSLSGWVFVSRCRFIGPHNSAGTDSDFRDNSLKARTFFSTLNIQIILFCRVSLRWWDKISGSFIQKDFFSVWSTNMSHDIDILWTKYPVFHKLFIVTVNSFEIVSVSSLNVLGWVFSGLTKWKTSTY